MGENRAVSAHTAEAVPDHYRTAEDKRIDQPGPGGDFPQHQKEKKNKYPQKKNKFLFSFLMPDILLLMI